MTFTEALELVVKGIEILGVAILVIGAAVSVGSYAADLRRSIGVSPTSACGRTSAGRSCLGSRS